MAGSVYPDPRLGGDVGVLSHQGVTLKQNLLAGCSKCGRHHGIGYGVRVSLSLQFLYFLSAQFLV